jgi:hypothetical protein
LLEPAEGSLDAIALFLLQFVVLALYLAVALGWNDSLCAHGLDVLEDGVGVVSLVGEDGLSLVLPQQAMA